MTQQYNDGTQVPTGSPDLVWDGGLDAGGTSLCGYFTQAGLPFEELVARLIGASGQDPTAAADGDKTSVEFSGTYKGHVFTLYDYKGDDELHIGGRRGLDVDGLVGALAAAVAGAQPVAYRADYPAEYGGAHMFIPEARSEGGTL